MPLMGDAGCTVQVTMEVISRRVVSRRPQVVGSCLMATLSVMPPVRSARPSSSEPYFSASYEPCSLKHKNCEFRFAKCFYQTNFYIMIHAFNLFQLCELKSDHRWQLK